MRTFVQALMIASLASAASGPTDAADPEPASFPLASVHFEQNATDGDVEVVFEVKAAKDGLAELTVVSPTGRKVVDFKAPDAATLGIRQFRFESPEPEDARALKAAYPEGIYEFSGKTASGAAFAGRSMLSHRLPATVTFLEPAAAATNIPIKDVRLSWTAVLGAAAYDIGLKQSELKSNFTALVPGSANSVGVPDGFLAPGKKYKMSIGAVSAEGNISYVETSFTTASQ
jgi:hypothetical protein